jgi:hypothetical protein
MYRLNWSLDFFRDRIDIIWCPNHTSYISQSKVGLLPEKEVLKQVFNHLQNCWEFDNFYFLSCDFSFAFRPSNFQYGFWVKGIHASHITV